MDIYNILDTQNAKLLRAPMTDMDINDIFTIQNQTIDQSDC